MEGCRSYGGGPFHPPLRIETSAGEGNPNVEKKAMPHFLVEPWSTTSWTDELREP